MDVGGVSVWYKPLIDLGIAGSFIAYLIYDRHIERNRKDKENDRWNRMENVLLELVGSTTKVIIEATIELKEQRASYNNLCAEVQRLITVLSTGSDHRRRATDHE
jgi:hypothetical protein